MANKYSLSVNKVTARPRSERLRKMGAGTGSGTITHSYKLDLSSIPIADESNMGLMTPDQVSKLYAAYNHLHMYEPIGIAVLTEAELEAAAEAGELEDGILYLGIEQ